MTIKTRFNPTIHITYKDLVTPNDQWYLTPVFVSNLHVTTSLAKNSHVISTNPNSTPFTIFSVMGKVWPIYLAIQKDFENIFCDPKNSETVVWTVFLLAKFPETLNVFSKRLLPGLFHFFRSGKKWKRPGSGRFEKPLGISGNFFNRNNFETTISENFSQHKKLFKKPFWIAKTTGKIFLRMKKIVNWAGFW